MIKFKIVSVNEAEHSFVVRFYSDLITEEMLAVDVLDGVIRQTRTDVSIDLPSPLPTGRDLINFVMIHAPKHWIEKQEDLLKPKQKVSLDEVMSLVGVEVTPEPGGMLEPVSTWTSPDVEQMNETFIRSIVQKVLAETEENTI